MQHGWRTDLYPETITDELAAALKDMLSGWRYIRQHHGDLYGVGWDRAESSADVALNRYRLLGCGEYHTDEKPEREYER